MKIRNGFVSNSSSSSFIAFGSTMTASLIDKIKARVKDNKIVLDDSGQTQFGWENTRYTSFWDRLNFTMIQIMSVNDKNSVMYQDSKQYNLLKKVLKDVLDVDTIYNNLTLEYSNKDGKIWSYIDHQSCLIEGENGEMFDSEENMRNFLFSEDSYIQGGNDNDDY